jgi:tetratricopeptide (TPR) repeat protein
MLKLKSHYIVFVLVSFCWCHAQSNMSDSLLSIIQNKPNDTNKVNLFNELSYQSYREGDFEAEMLYGKKALELAQQLKWKKGIADSYKNIGGAYEDLGDYNSAHEHYLYALKIYQELKNQNGISAIYNNIGEVCRYLGNYPEALKNYFAALAIKEEIEDKAGLSIVYNNMGIVYERQGNHDEALKNHMKSLEIEIELGDQLLIASSYNNIGLVYEQLANYDAALDYHFKALHIRESNANKFGMAHSYNNIGIIYYEQGNYEESIKYCMAALQISEEIGDRTGIVSAYNNLGRIYIATGKAKSAIPWLAKALVIAKELGHKELMKSSYSGLFMADSTTGNYQSALYNYQQFITVRDSLINEENTKLSVQLEMQFAFDKKDALAKAEQDKKDALAAEKIQKQELQRNVLLSGLMIMLLLLGIIYRSYRNKRKANHIISKQKEEVEAQRIIAEKQKQLVQEKNNEIVDSITYAKNLQDAILPPISLLEELLPEVFVLYQPKDIIAGDFYWLETLDASRGENSATNLMQNLGSYDSNSVVEQKERGSGFNRPNNMEKTILLAAADCTGHGVPGAMVSVVCSNALHRSHVEFGLTSPGKILDKARELVIQTFAKAQGSVQDGMDISLVAISQRAEDKSLCSHSISWSGANNPLWIIRKGTMQVEEIKADKQPVGKYDNPMPFTTHTVEFLSGDIFYLFTDGFQDQFGGDKGKKFKASKLRELLVSIHHETMQKQQQLLQEAFENWKGSLEQVDDVCIIGVRF